MNFENVKKYAKYGAITLYLYDVYYIYNYLNHYYKDLGPIDQKQADLLLKDAIDEENLITKEQFNARLNDLEFELQNRNNNDGIYSDGNSTFYKVMRESILFSGGGRAALLQLCHPFVATGIKLHSNLAFGIQQRFFRTFKYMFGMTFGTVDDALHAGRTVRSLHDKVVGNLEESVGGFAAGSKFDAKQGVALRWVAATLTETAIMKYELFVKKLSESEKDEIIRLAQLQNMLFGIPKSDKPMTYREFMQFNNTMWNSGVLEPGPTALGIFDFLLEPPALIYAPLMNLVRWSTALSLPPRFQEMVLGRKKYQFETIILAFLYAQIRFVYRLCPGAFRYLTAYINREKRVGHTYNVFEELLSSLSAKITRVFLASAMPVRDPELIKESLKKMKEKEAWLSQQRKESIKTIY